MRGGDPPPPQVPLEASRGVAASHVINRLAFVLSAVSELSSALTEIVF
jgi:hypothetical protein